KKRFTAEGGHRAASPQETFERYKHHISPITGVVSSILSKEDASHGYTHSYASGHYFPMETHRMLDLRTNLRSRSGGKGLTDIEAKVGALCEAIERYSGVFSGDEPTIQGSYTELKPEAVHPNDCMLFSKNQYRIRKRWNAEHTLHNFYHVVPDPFDEGMPIDWTPVWSLTQDTLRYLPSAYCYFGHPDLKKFFCVSDTNGNAAGNTIEEAVIQGFMELVERDSVAIWWYNRIQRPGVDLDSFDQPYLRELLSLHERLDRELWVLDITSDLNIPAFAAVSRRVDRPVEDIIVGFSAHLDPLSAILHAITEVNQFLPSLSQTAADGTTDYYYNDQEAIDWWMTATIEKQPYLVPDPTAAWVKRSDFAPLVSDDLMTDVHTCIEISRQHDLEMLVLDHTRPDISLSVVKVIVPGLRHFWRRLGPGRLYDIPVKLGWFEKPLRENQLNPVSMFF
nr:adenylate cyclase [Anaerolineales bacterium]